MIRFVCWTCFAIVFGLFNQVNLVWGRCTDRNVQIEGGTYTLSNNLTEGSVLIYKCNEGFYPDPHLVRVCKYNGMWNPAPGRSRCRLIECPDPAVIENGNVLPSEPRYFYQNVITYHCYEGYELYGPSHRTCLSNGKWSGPHSVCRRDSGAHCPDPGIPPGSSRVGFLFGLGETVTYSCNDNDMILIGSEERVCQEDRHWSGIEPTCYYQHTYDTPKEVSYEFGSGIKNTFATLETETNVTQAERLIRLTQSGTLNIYIALDISSSINQEHFENAKKAVLTLIEKIASFSVTPNYEVIFFSSKPIEIINILSFFDDNKKSLAALVNELKNYEIKKRDQTGTNLTTVFETFLEKMAVIKHRQANFKEHQHVIIVFTDGGYNMGGSPEQSVKRIKSMVLMNEEIKRKKHLDIYIFGIGSQIYDRNLQSLTYGVGEKHYFRLQNEEELQDTFNDIIDEEEVTGLCGLHKNYGDLSGSKDKRKKYPWVVFIDILTEGKISHCLGSLVSPRFVLTAAHCFTVGDFITGTKVQADGHQFDVKAIHKHPQYNISANLHQGVKEFYDYDVALIELTRDVHISVSLRPICIPCTVETNGALRQNLSCQAQERFLITNNERVNFLTKINLGEKHAHIKLGENRVKCFLKALTAPGVNTTDVSMVVNENFLCSGGIFPEVDRIACKGDSGGAVYKNYLDRTIQVALVSWGNKVMPKCQRGGLVASDEESRDFHLNLFKVVPFLKSILGKVDQNYAPLAFVD